MFRRILPTLSRQISREISKIGRRMWTARTIGSTRTISGPRTTSSTRTIGTTRTISRTHSTSDTRTLIIRPSMNHDENPWFSINPLAASLLTATVISVPIVSCDDSSQAIFEHLQNLEKNISELMDQGQFDKVKTIIKDNQVLIVRALDAGLLNDYLFKFAVINSEAFYRHVMTKLQDGTLHVSQINPLSLWVLRRGSYTDREMVDSYLYDYIMDKIDSSDSNEMMELLTREFSIVFWRIFLEGQSISNLSDECLLNILARVDGARELFLIYHGFREVVNDIYTKGQSDHEFMEEVRQFFSDSNPFLSRELE